MHELLEFNLHSRTSEGVRRLIYSNGAKILKSVLVYKYFIL